jgi:alkylresorcinol/alkylpyrone synthase
MARVISSAKAIPPYNVKQSLAADFARQHFGPKYRDIERLMGIFESSRIEQRQFCVPPEWFFSAKTFQEKNDTYIRSATNLGEEAARACLESGGVAPGDVDQIIFVSTTGLATPSIDARLINLLGLRSDIKRLPIWGLGCVGGAAGLALAHDQIKAYPDSKVLLVAIELCGLTFQFDDFGKSNLVAMALFADGAAAVLLGNDGVGPEIIDARCITWPDSLDIMGWNVLNEGFQVVFARAIPSIVRTRVKENVESFLAPHGLDVGSIEHFLFHPGGAKVIDAYKEAFHLAPDALCLTEAVLRNHGNMSAVTVLYILDEFLKLPNGKSGAYGLLTALGPGFTAQNILFRT